MEDINAPLELSDMPPVHLPNVSVMETNSDLIPSHMHYYYRAITSGFHSASFEDRGMILLDYVEHFIRLFQTHKQCVPKFLCQYWDERMSDGQSLKDILT